MKDQLRKFFFVIAYAIVLLGSVNSHAVSLECSFAYNDDTYEWVRADEFSTFRYINDSGQAVISSRALRVSAFEPSIVLVSFLDNDTFNERQHDIVASYDFDGEYDDLIEFQILGFNNAGEVYGDIYLITGTDADGNALPGGFPPNSARFAFVWDKTNGFRDLADIVQGLTGRTDIGSETGIAIDYINGHQFYVKQYAPPAAEVGVPFPFELLEPQDSPIPADMLDAIKNQCGDSPYILALVVDAAQSSRFNNNLEFIHGPHLVRKARPNIDIGIGHVWRTNSGEFISPPRAAHLPGKVGERLTFGIGIKNSGAVDITNLQVSAKIIDSSPAGVLKFNGTDYNGTFFKAGIDEGLPTALASFDRINVEKLHTTVKPGTVTFEVVVTGNDPNGNAVEFKKTDKITVESNSPSLIATLAFTDGRSSALIESLDKEFGITLNVSASEGEGAISNIQFSNLFFNATNLTVIKSPTVPAEGYTVEPGESLPPINWTLKPNAPGRWRLATTVTGTDEFGIGKSDDAILLGSVGGMSVEIKLPDEGVELEEETNGVDANGDGLADKPGYAKQTFPVQIIVSVPLEGTDLTEVKFGISNDPNPLKIGKTRFVHETGQWVPVAPPSPFPISVASGPVLISPDTQGVIKAGNSATYEFNVEASDVGSYDFSTIVEAKTVTSGGSPSSVVRGSDEDRLTITGGAILSLQLKIQTTHGRPPRVDEGNAIEVVGHVENLSDDQWLQLAPIRMINDGQGIVLGPISQDDSSFPPAGQPGIFTPLLPPTLDATVDNPSSQTFRVRVETDQLPGLDWDNLAARQSILLDAFVGGTVIEPDGTQRDLLETEILVELGNGRYVNSKSTYLRAEVEPKLKPPQDLTPEQFATISAGLAMERLATGSGNALASFPAMLKALPAGVITIANTVGAFDVEVYIASQNLNRFMWAWLDYQTDVWLGLSSETTQQQLQLISDELFFYYSDRFETVDEVRQLVNQGITGFFTKILDYEERAYKATEFGFNEELAKVIAEPFETIGGTVTEEVVTGALISWFSKIGRSAKILDEVEESRELFVPRAQKQVAEATDEVAAAGRAGDPRVTEMPRGMRALPAGAPVSPLQALKGWVVDKVSDQNLRRMTDVKNGGMSIIVAIRSRADETIEWLNTPIGITVKPETFKPKNVNPDDVRFLGYRDGVGYDDINGAGAGDRGATALAEPIDFDVVRNRLDNAGVDFATEQRVIERYNKRWKEWHGADFPNKSPGSSAVDKLKARTKIVDVSGDRIIRRGTLDVPKRGKAFNSADNLDTAGTPVLEPRRFEMRQVKNPPGHQGREYWETWLEDDDGVLKRVAGDIDVVAVTDTAGFALPVASEFTETVARNLQHGIKAQHPWTTTWNNPKGRAEALADHRWDPDPANRGEPLLLYVNGEARVGWFHPTRTITAENPLDAMVWLDGGSADIDDVVRFQRDLRHLPDPVDVPSTALKPVSATVKQALIISDLTTNGANNLVATCSIRTARTGAALYRIGKRDVLEKQHENAEWSEVDPAAECEDNEIVVLPETGLLVDTMAGSSTLNIIESLLGFDWQEMFQIGDTILIGSGTDNPEQAVIADKGSLILATPLKFDHPAGTSIVMIQAREEQVDSDGDGIPDGADVFPNNPDESFDSDQDGIGNNADPDDDNDGTSDADEVRFGSDPLNNLDTPEQHRPVKPILSSMLPDTAKPLTHFDLGISAFSDPDESGDATEVEVTVEGPIDGGVGTVFNRRTRGDELPALELPAGTLDTGSDYTMSVRYFDASGQASDASDVFAFTTETQDPADLNDNRIEDVAEVTADMDINKNNIDDASEGITVILNAENGDALGISVDKGTLSDVSVLSEADIPDGMVPAKVTDLPLGMTGFRVSDLTPGDEVTVTFHLLSSLPANKAWYQYDSLSEALVDITGQAVFNSDGTVSIKYVDGGVGDLDGVANGRIIDPSGPAAVTAKKNNTGGSSGGGGGGAYNLTALVLLTLALFMLRRLRAGKSH